MSSTQISEYIARKTKGEILKVSGTVKDSLENRLKKAGYVKGVDILTKKNEKGVFAHHCISPQREGNC